MTINIINEPETAKDYEFVVGSPIDGEETYFFQGMFENGYDAEQCAKECGGIIFHNVRIQGKRKPPKKKYWVRISYTAEIEAESQDEAYDIFDEQMANGDYYDFDWCYDIEEAY